MKRISVLFIFFCLLVTGVACNSSTDVPTDAAESEIDTQAIKSFYVDPNSTSAQWVRNNPRDGRADRIRRHIASKPMAKWIGDWTPNIETTVANYTKAAKDKGQTPIFVAYNIPGRDCGQHSSGGAGSPKAYEAWIIKFARGIKKHNIEAVVILEPDALPLVADCSRSGSTKAVTDMLADAVYEFGRVAPKAKVYIDAGNAEWKSASEMKERLIAANVYNAAGFALNTSNYHRTWKTRRYGNDIAKQLGGNVRFVIDTSRNGAGPDGTNWCNPANRKLGSTSRVVSGKRGLEMLLWIKTPGESDGDCGVGRGTRAGQFMPEEAYRMTLR